MKKFFIGFLIVVISICAVIVAYNTTPKKTAIDRICRQLDNVPSTEELGRIPFDGFPEKFTVGEYVYERKYYKSDDVEQYRADYVCVSHNSVPSEVCKEIVRSLRKSMGSARLIISGVSNTIRIVDQYADYMNTVERRKAREEETRRIRESVSTVNF